MFIYFCIKNYIEIALNDKKFIICLYLYISYINCVFHQGTLYELGAFSSQQPITLENLELEIKINELSFEGKKKEINYIDNRFNVTDENEIHLFEYVKYLDEERIQMDEERQIELKLKKLQKAYEDMFTILQDIQKPNTWAHKANLVLNKASERLARTGLITGGKVVMSYNPIFNLLGMF